MCTRPGYRTPRFISFIRKSHERTASAMIVSVGFWHALDVKPAPSMTNRFLTSCVCWNWFSTDVFALAPMRATPTSWMPIPGMRSVTVHGRCTFRAPAASSISAADVGHVGNHRGLVRTPAHTDAQHRDAEYVDDIAIECDRVLAAREAFAEAAEIQRRDRTEQRALNASPKPGALQLKSGPPHPPWNP